MKGELTRTSVVNEVMGQIMRDARKQAGFTQEQAEKILRIPQTRISVYERGSSAIPFERVVKMCRLYGIDIRWVAKTIEAVAE